MSGWQRLGVVMSVLWAVGAPLGFVFETNRSAGQWFDSCLKMASSVSGDYTWDAAKGAKVYDKMSSRCQGAYLASTTSLSKMVADDGDKKFLAWVIGGPIVVLWLLGGITITTLRWISRGFRARKSV